MNFFYFLNVNKSKTQRLNKNLNVGNDVNFDVKLALEKLRERNLNVFSKLFFDFNESNKSFRNTLGANTIQDSFNENFISVNAYNTFYNKKFYKNINKLNTFTKNKYNYLNSVSSDTYNLSDLKILGSLNFLNNTVSLTVDDFYSNFFIFYGGYVSSLISKSFQLNSFFSARKRNFSNFYNNKLISNLSSDSIFFKSKKLSSFYLHTDSIFDEYNVKNSFIQKYENLNHVYDFLYSQRKNNKKLLRKKSIYSNYAMFKRSLTSHGYNTVNFRLSSRFFYSLNNIGDSMNFKTILLPLTFKMEQKENPIVIKDALISKFSIVKNVFHYLLSSLVLSNNNIFKSGLISKFLFFVLFRVVFTFKFSMTGFNFFSKFDILKNNNTFFFNKFYLLALLVFTDRRYIDGLKSNYNVLLLSTYLSQRSNFMLKT